MSSPHVCFADMPEYENRHRSRRQHNGKKYAANDENDENEAHAADNINGGDGDGSSDGGCGGLRGRRRRHGSKERRSISPSSISPTPTATPRYERNLGFFQQLSRRFGLRSNDDLLHCTAGEDDAHSSSTDSSSTSSATPPSTHNANGQSKTNDLMVNNKDVVHGSSLEHISCASSETSSTVDIEDQQQRELEQQQQQSQSQLQPQSLQQRQSKQLLPNGSGNKKAERKSISRSSFSRLHRRSTSSIRRAFESFSLSSRSLSCSGPTPPNGVPSIAGHKNGAHTTSNNSNNSSYGGTPIKSALKSSSNTELNKRTAYFATTSHSFSAGSSANGNGGGCNAVVAAAKSSKTKAPPQRILRQPVSYTYLKGISGLPTQRVPRNSVCCQYARR